MNIRLSVIIVNWNVRGYLKICLDSIYKYTKDIEFEVYVVDNNSSDGSQDMVKKDFPQVHLIENSKNLGFAAANNLALKECGAEYDLFLNPDTELVDNALKAMVGYMDTHPETGAMGCKLLLSDGSLQYSCRAFPSIFADLMENLYLDWIFPRSAFFNCYHMGLWEHNYAREVSVPAGACLLVRQGIIRKIGPFDTRFFMYYDEIDLCYRIRKNGWKIFFVPDIKVIHHTNQSSKQIPLETADWKYGSKIRFFKKHFGAWSVMFLFLSLALNGFIVWGLFPVSHLLSGRPRDNDYIKAASRIAWKSYIKFVKFGKCKDEV